MKFKIENKEFLEWKKFREKHKECKFPATEGGKFSFIFTPNGLGTCISVRCNVCDEIKDITDISNW